jgi:hypothetical protein
MSGGMVEYIVKPQLQLERFDTPELERLWNYTWYARRFFQQHLPFWHMEPADDLVRGAATLDVPIGRRGSYKLGAQVLALPPKLYAVYFPTATRTGTLDLSRAKGRFSLRWYNPRTGKFAGSERSVRGGDPVKLGQPPDSPKLDWVALLTQK